MIPTRATMPARPRRLRVALVPWMVAGVRTQYENLRAVEPPTDLLVNTFPIVPYEEGGIVERLPILQTTQKGTLRSTIRALPVLKQRYDVVWTQVLLPLAPLLLAGRLGLRPQPAIVFAIDTTPALMDEVTPIYYGRKPATSRKRIVRDAAFRAALGQCAIVAPWSAWAARSFVRDYAVPTERIRVMPPGVDLTMWTPAQRDTAMPERPFRLLFVGADFARKGGPLLLEVFRNHLRGRCELHLVTKAVVEYEAGVHTYQQFGPNDPGLRLLYAQSDALVLPTRADCFSLAAIEAMACGLPVITCPVGGIPEIVEDGRTGLLVPPDDARALLLAIEALLAAPERADAMGRAGRKLAEERFDNHRISLALLDLLRQVCDRTQTAPIGSRV